MARQAGPEGPQAGSKRKKAEGCLGRITAGRLVSSLSVASVDLPDPRRSSYGLDYWLHRCHGFTVEHGRRKLGTVTGLRFRASIEPEQLEVRTGLLGRRVLLIPVERVKEIVPEQKLITLTSYP